MHLDAPHNPYDLFAEWFAAAEAGEPDMPDAAALATCGADGQPSVRMVLIKHVDQNGFVFYNNLGSRKTAEIAANPRVALCFHWKSLHKQVRVEGEVAAVADSVVVGAAFVDEAAQALTNKCDPVAKTLESAARLSEAAHSVRKDGPVSA